MGGARPEAGAATTGARSGGGETNHCVVATSCCTSGDTLAPRRMKESLGLMKPAPAAGQAVLAAARRRRGGSPMLISFTPSRVSGVI